MENDKKSTVRNIWSEFQIVEFLSCLRTSISFLIYSEALHMCGRCCTCNNASFVALFVQSDHKIVHRSHTATIREKNALISCQSMLNLTTHYGFHELYFNQIVLFPRKIYQIYNKTISLLNSDYCLTPDEHYISYI